MNKDFVTFMVLNPKMKNKLKKESILGKQRSFLRRFNRQQIFSSNFRLVSTITIVDINGNFLLVFIESEFEGSASSIKPLRLDLVRSGRGQLIRGPPLAREHHSCQRR